MSWQDDPIAPASAGSSDWQNDPIVQEPGKVESFARGAANNFPFAPQVIAKGESMTGIGDEGGYSKNLADWNQKAAAAKEANPVTYGTGAILGAAAPLAIPGVGEALEAAPIAGNAALGAVGAISNQDLTKNPSDIAKNALEGAAIGGTLGKAGEAIGEGLSSAKSSLEPAVNRIRSNALAGGLDLNSHAIRRLAKGDVNPETTINDVSDKLEKLIPDLVGYTDTAGSKLNKIVTAHNQASDAIGKIVDETTQKTGSLPEVNEAISDLRNSANKFNGRTSSANLEAKNILNDKALDLEELQKSGQMNFKNLYEVKKGIGDAFHSPNVNHGDKIAYGIVSDAIDKILDRTNVSNPAYKDAFNHQKELFKLTSDLIPAMKPGVAREVAGVGGGVLSAGLGTAAVMGHPAAVPAYVGKQATKFLAPDLGQNIAYKAVKGAKNLPNFPKHTGKVLTQEMIDYINSKRQQ